MRHDRRSLRGGGTAPLKVWNASILQTQFLVNSQVVRFLRKKNEMPFCDEADLSGLGIRSATFGRDANARFLYSRAQTERHMESPRPTRPKRTHGSPVLRAPQSRRSSGYRGSCDVLPIVPALPSSCQQGGRD